MSERGAGAVAASPSVRVAVLPSWYPTAASPISGVFVREQVDAISRWHPDVDVHVLHVPLNGPGVTPKRPLASTRALLRFAREPVWSTRQLRANWHEHTVRRIEVSERVGGAGMRVELRDCRRWLRDRIAVGAPIDVLHAHVSAPGGILAVRLGAEFGIPVVLTEHMSPFPLPALCTPSGAPVPDVIEACNRADRLLAVSAALAAEIREATGAQAAVLPNGVDGERFHPRAAGAGANAGPVFLGAGYLVPQKGFDDLLCAFQRVVWERPDARLRIIGDGPERGNLARLADRLEIADRVEWLGQRSRDEVAPLFRAADVFVLSSRHESLGMVVIEALASGLPVVATDCGGPRDVVPADAGRLVPVGDVAALAAGMLAVARDLPAPHAPARGAFEARFSDRRVAERLVGVYRELAAARAAATDVPRAVGAPPC